MEDRKCPRCGAAMESGILEEAFWVLQWAPKINPKRTKQKGKHPPGRIRIVAFRCPKCATVESTAPLA